MSSRAWILHRNVGFMMAPFAATMGVAQGYETMRYKDVPRWRVGIRMAVGGLTGVVGSMMWAPLGGVAIIYQYKN